MILSFLLKSHHARIAVSSPLLLLTNVAYAGVDWTRYDDAPTLFLGWETSFYFLFCYSSDCVAWLVLDIDRSL